MELITRQSNANGAAKRWSEQYKSGKHGEDKMNITQLLRGLPDNPNPDDVDKIIGNTSWTKVDNCNECGCSPDKLVEIGQEPDYESMTAYLCLSCLKDAVKLLEA